MAKVEDFLHIVVDAEEFERIRRKKKLTVEDERRLHGVESVLLMVHSVLYPYKHLLKPRQRRVYQAIAQFIGDNKKTQEELFNELAMWYSELPYPDLFKRIEQWNKSRDEAMKSSGVSVPAHTLTDATSQELERGYVWIEPRGQNAYREQIRKRVLSGIKKVNAANLRQFKLLRKSKTSDLRGEDENKDLKKAVLEMVKTCTRLTKEELIRRMSIKWKMLKPILSELENEGRVEMGTERVGKESVIDSKGKPQVRFIDREVIVYQTPGEMDRDESAIPIQKLPHKKA